jgi:uncharacterized repeat protein (TIGR03803 family)
MGGTEKVLHSFGDSRAAFGPEAGLIVNGTLNGTTAGGAFTTNCGTVFSITPDGTETVLYSFKGGTTDGSDPEAAAARTATAPSIRCRISKIVRQLFSG